MLFTDGSVSTKLRIGYGAYLALPEGQEPLTSHIKLKQFVDTSSTKLELQTLLWALSEISASEVISYTDSQNIIGLPGRRARLEQSNYFSSKNKRLNNYELYQEFYRLTSGLKCELVKVVGHQASSKKGEIDRLFGLVDQASRRALQAEF